MRKKLNPAKTSVDFQQVIGPHSRTGHHVVIINSVELNILFGKMSLPPYAPDSDKPSGADRAVVGVGSAVIAFIAFFFAGAFVLSFARADFFGGIGISYATFGSLCGVWLLKTPRYRGFSVGIFCGVACYFFLMMLAGSFSRGFWK